MTDLALLNRTTPQQRCSSHTHDLICGQPRGHAGEHKDTTTGLTWPRSI